MTAVDGQGSPELPNLLANIIISLSRLTASKTLVIWFATKPGPTSPGPATLINFSSSPKIGLQTKSVRL